MCLLNSLGVYDQRVAGNIILALSSKESKANIRDPRLVYPNGTVEAFVLGIPRSCWANSGKLFLLCVPPATNAQTLHTSMCQFVRVEHFPTSSNSDVKIVFEPIEILPLDFCLGTSP